MWWDAERNGRYYNCTISGGYVVLGARGKNILEDHTSIYCGLEEFLQGKLHDDIRTVRFSNSKLDLRSPLPKD